jgi:hypothetical protein
VIYIGGSLMKEGEKKDILSSGYEFFWERPLNINYIVDFLKSNKLIKGG